MPDDASLAKLFRDSGERREIERVERGAEWVAVLRGSEPVICIIGARDLAALRYRMEATDQIAARPDSVPGQVTFAEPVCATASRTSSSGCRTARPVPCRICCRQETPVAAMSVPAGSARTAGNSRSPPICIDSS